MSTPLEDPFILAFIDAVKDVDAEEAERMERQVSYGWPEDERFRLWLTAFKKRFTLIEQPAPGERRILRILR